MHSERLLKSIFFILLAIIPFNIGGTAPRYVLSILIIITCFSAITSSGKNRFKEAYALSREFFRHPLSWALGFLCVTAFISIFMSPDWEYSFWIFCKEYLLNFTLFISLLLFSEKYGRKTNWLEIVTAANVVFLIFYLGLMSQLLLSQGEFWFLDTDTNVESASIGDKIFIFSYANTLFNGIKHTSLYLTLLIAVVFVYLVKHQHRIRSLILLLVNLFALISTTRRGAILSVSVGMVASSLFYSSAKKYLAILSLLFFLTVSALFISDKTEYFIREDWKLMFQGEVRKAKDIGGSIPLRIYTYLTFTKEVLKHPFAGTGLGRKNIKRLMPDIIKEAGLVHGHNAFLELAIETGIQGALALLITIIIQARMLWSCWKNDENPEIKGLMATGLLFMIMFWGTNMFTDGFRHGSSTLYWLFMAIPTGIAYAAVQKNV
ncbi:MAG: O-antigen ligase family protein [Deltaproteobacteria bacterium]|nr:O-antigen ligase family protein [Deltaproteobacteria bacterium]